MVAIALALLTAGASAITPDPAVVWQMRSILPYVIATLALHGSAVTLEGLLLARKDLRELSATYVFVGGTVAAMLALARRSPVGLAGVWAAYVWLQISRFALFTWIGGLLGRKPAPGRVAA